MRDPLFVMMIFALFALMIGVVIFGGTTLTYLLDKRRPGAPNHLPVQRLHERSKVTVAGDNMDPWRDKAA